MSSQSKNSVFRAYVPHYPASTGLSHLGELETGEGSDAWGPGSPEAQGPQRTREGSCLPSLTGGPEAQA